MISLNCRKLLSRRDIMGKKGRNTQAKKPLKNEEPKQRNENFKGDGNPKLDGENRPAT